MKTSLTILLLFLLQFSVNHLSAQSYQNENSGLPLKQENSILFGKDIVIHNQTDRDQRNIAICSSFNGWLFAVYSYPIGIQQAISVLKSTDNGISWDLLGEGEMIIASSTTRLDIIVLGNSIPDLKIFVGYVYLSYIPNVGGAYVNRYNADPFYPEDELLQQDGGNIKDLILSSDYMYPSTNSNPFSLGVLYSKVGTKDSIIFRSSSNGGMSLDRRRVVATTSMYFHKVALNYGRSSSWNSGRYFAAWEEQEDLNTSYGHIYTAHSNPYFNSLFSKPVCLDSLDPSAINKARNPAIACQFSDTDNDSANLTEVVTFEKFLPTGNNYDVKGFYNLQAASSNYFREFSFSSSSNNKLQPYISFNPYSSTFMMTYFDSTERKLPYLTNNVNLSYPDSWNIISQAYNDSTILIAPYPKAKLNIGQQDGMNVWIAEGTGGKGIAMFDAPYSTWTGASESNKTNGNRLYGVFPNPCKTYTTVVFELDRSELVTISLFNVVGERTGTLTSQIYLEGKHQVNLDLSMYPAGCYLYTFNTGRFVSSGKIVVTK